MRGATCFIIALLFCISPCRANELSKECGTIKLAYLEIGALYYRDANGNYQGIDKDIIDEIARRTTCHFETRIESQARIWTQMREGGLDMSVSGIRTKEREKLARPIPYFSMRNYILLRSDLPADAHSVKGFSANPQLRLAIIKSFQHGSAYNKFIEQLKLQGRVYEVADFASLIHLYNAKRVDAILALPTSFQVLIDQKKLVPDTVVKDWYPNDQFVAALFVSRSNISDDTFNLLFSTVKAMNTDGTVEQIFSKHVGNKLAKEMHIEIEDPI
jgi:polar amino acid transport system substrate-binding protein